MFPISTKCSAREITFWITHSPRFESTFSACFTERSGNPPLKTVNFFAFLDDQTG